MKYSIQSISEELARDGWKTTSNNYSNLDGELTFVCDEGHSFASSWRKVRQNRECPICKNNKHKNQTLSFVPKKKGVYRILALDQATKVSGYSIYDNKELVRYGTFQTKAEDEEFKRDNDVKIWLISMIENWQPDFVAIEGLQFQESFGVTTFETLARLQGIIANTIYEYKIPFKICPTNTWRAHCGVKGRHRDEKKRSMQSLVKKWFDISVSDDCADAIGIGKYASETFAPKKEIISWE